MTGGSQASGDRVVREERGWTLSFSRSGVSFRRFSYLFEDGAVAGRGSRASPGGSARRRRLWLVPMLLGGGSIAAGVLAAPASSSGHLYSVSLAVPDRVVHAAVHPSRSVGRYAAPVRRHRAVVVRDDEVNLGLGAGDAEGADVGALGAGTNEAAEQRYTDRAMRTGAMQSWQSDSVRYFLVAGDLQRGDDKACRQFSLLARPDGGADSVRQFERCRVAE